ncbi:MAG: Peptide/nickel transport system ATP-binding protein [Amycolatopsis sp.]|jgi:peptide/nickel transport system ATP-binding protein|uniref:ABC transporter ATP-binding protein n=1 Tax=Amycolatopsis sp. TaxID=37632 RepID=UPI002611BFCC|nr:ABC transporter ATP-binding protein [Amycolatopsis sp.]MCU1679416.1 Peptide/nickel transport system ATP-binding protein [Amycolatopsis sp.]
MNSPVLEAVGLTKHFRVRGKSARHRAVVHAVDDVSLSLYAGEVTALVGESGSGKSTVARLLAQLMAPTSGSIRLRGEETLVKRGKPFRDYVSSVQLMLQDPFGSFNPVHTVGHHLRGVLNIHRRGQGKVAEEAAIDELLREVSLTPSTQYTGRYPHELSGGQRQRISIARALAAGPDVLLADEPVSMLDVSIRLGVLNLLAKLAAERELALLYITHDIASARYFATNTVVMYAGRLIEGGPSETVTQQPAHPYTQLLIASAPDPGRPVAPVPPASSAGLGTPPSLIDPPAGCRFHPRCPLAMDRCKTDVPPKFTLTGGHWAACWLHEKSENAASVAPAEQPRGSQSC